MSLRSTNPCCFCCNLLFEALFKSGRDLERRQADKEERFKVPGLVVPWTAPPIAYGVPLEALEMIHDELLALLTQILQEYLQPVIAQFDAKPDSMDEDFNPETLTLLFQLT